MFNCKMVVKGYLIGIGMLLSTSLFAASLKGPSYHLDGEGVPVISLKAPYKDDLVVRQKRLPCGKQTIAVLERKSGGVIYAFCGDGEGSVGVLEILENGMETASVLRATGQQPGQLLNKLLDKVPQGLMDNIMRGKPADKVFRATVEDSSLDPLPFGIGVPSTEAPASGANHPYCQDQNEWGSYFSNAATAFYSRSVSCSSNAEADAYSICINGHRFFDNGGGSLSQWSQRTASAYPETSEGACVAYAKVRACGSGSTRFQAFERPTAGAGGWNQTLDFWMGSGGHATWARFASADRCTPGRDKDDFRFRADSSSGGSHRYGYVFVRELDSESPCLACTNASFQ